MSAPLDVGLSDPAPPSATPVPAPDGAGPGGELRRTSIVAAGALLAMALLAPVGLLFALPEGHTEVAALTVLVVASLDVVAAIALYPLLRPGGALLAQVVVALRLVYAAAFVSGAGFLLGPVEVARFEAQWDAALLVFGLHLGLAGIVAWRGRLIPRWVGALLVVAGAGYIVDTVLVLAAVDLAVGGVTFVGEVALLVWLLGWGGRSRAATRV